MEKNILILMRIFSALIDILIYSLLMFLLKPIINGNSDYYSGSIVILSYYLFFMFQDILLGRTFGKLILGLKIIFLKNNDYWIIRLFIRRLFDLIELVIPLIYLFFIIFNKGNRKFGDLLSKTKIIIDK